MVAGGFAGTTAKPMDSSAALRMGRLDALKSRMGRTGRAAMTGLSLMSAAQASPQRDTDDVIRRDPISQLRADRTTVQRYANPQVSTPSFQAMTDSLRSDGDTEDIASADALDDYMMTVADEAGQTDDLSLLSRAKSQWQAKMEEGKQKIIKKGQKEVQAITQKVQTEGAAKFASAADEGELFEVVDTIGTGVSVANVGISVFQESINEQMREMLARQGIGTLKPTSILDLFIVAGTEMQALKWSFVVCVLLPYCVVFLVLTYANIGTIVFDSVSSLLPSL